MHEITLFLLCMMVAQQKEGIGIEGVLSLIICYIIICYIFFKLLDGLKCVDREAATIIFSPVCGFLPSLAALSFTSNVPNPIS